MNIILLSGGSGKRLWPLSNEFRSKQFLKIFKKNDGTHESMVQRMYRKIKEVDDNALITIATSEDQLSSIYTQLCDRDLGLSIEPSRKDTFPAIALATAYLHDRKKLSVDESVVVCPVDPFVDDSYFIMLKELYNQSLKGEANITLMGIEPTYPSEKYGYIIPKSDDYISEVETFKEKPNLKTAEVYIKNGALWNGGVFAYSLKYVLNIAESIWGISSYQDILDNYNSLSPISFDYAVVEKEHQIQVMRFAGIWKDLGTWNTFTEAMSEEVSGNVIMDNCKNTHVVNELQIPLVVLGVNDVVSVATPDGILVANKNESDRLKKYVLDQRPMCEKRPWGEYQILDYRNDDNNQHSITKHIRIKQGKHISYHIHNYRSEVWTVLNGTGKIVLDGETSNINRGDSISIHAGVKHGIMANTDLHIIEVQIGNELSEEDIERFDWNWDY